MFFDEDDMLKQALEKLEEAQLQILEQKKELNEGSKVDSDPQAMERLEQKLDMISKMQENANKDGTKVDQMQNDLIQFMQGEQKKLLEQMAKMQREAEAKVLSRKSHEVELLINVLYSTPRDSW